MARDPQGVIRVDIELSGAVDSVFTRNIVPSSDSIQIDTVIAIPETALGPLSITARAQNALDVTGQDGPIELTETVANCPRCRRSFFPST